MPISQKMLGVGIICCHLYLLFIPIHPSNLNVLSSQKKERLIITIQSYRIIYDKNRTVFNGIEGIHFDPCQNQVPAVLRRPPKDCRL